MWSWETVSPFPKLCHRTKAEDGESVHYLSTKTMTSPRVKEDPGTTVPKGQCVEFASLAVGQDVGVKSLKALAMSPREFSRERYQKGCSNLMSFKSLSNTSSVYRGQEICVDLGENAPVIRS